MKSPITVYGLDNNGNVFLTGFTCYVDEHGNAVERTPQTNPYNYDSFLMWRGGANKEANGCVYSDRLFQWDHEKHDRLCQKHFGNRGQYWDNRDIEKIEAFLRDYNDDPKLKLIYIMQCCNQSSGYPCWAFCYKNGEK